MNRRIAVPALPMSSARPRRPQAVQAHAVHADLAGSPGARCRTPRARSARERRQAVLAGEKAADLGHARGDAAQHQRAMRNRFVAGNADAAPDTRNRPRQIARRGSAHRTPSRQRGQQRKQAARSARGVPMVMRRHCGRP